MTQVPTIDIGPLFNRDTANQRSADKAIGAAILSHGGFALCGYPDAELLDQRARATLDFFDLPERGKNAVATRAYLPTGKRVYRGFSAHKDQSSWAHTEMFDIGPPVPKQGPALKGVEVFAETNQWPDPAPTPTWRASMEAYYSQLESIARAILKSVGRAVGVPQSRLEEKFRDGNSTLRLLNYPEHELGATVLDPSLGAAKDAPPILARRHTDASGLSLLWQGSPGLQAEGPDGTWHDIPIAPTGVSVHLGTTLEMMTGGKVRATPHRVLDFGKSRQSIGFFLEPGLSQRLTPVSADASADDDGAEDLRGTYGWHLMERFSTFDDYQGLVPPPELPGQ